MRSRRASAPSLSAKRAVRRGGTLTRQKRSYLPVNTLDEAENVPLFSNIVALYVALDIGKMRLVKTIPDATPLDIGELESVAETEASYPSAELESRLAETEGDIDKLLEMKKAELSKAYRGLFGVNPPQRARKPDIAEAISAFIQGQANIPTPAGSIVPPPPSVAQTLPSINEGDGGGEGGITGSGRPYYAPTLAGRWSIYNSVPQKQRSLTARRTLETALNKPLPPFTFTHTTRSNRQQRKAIERRTNQRRLAQQRASRIQVEKNTKREILDPTYFSREILDEDDE